MHILIVASYYPTAGNPVTGIFIEKQALMLRRAGHQVGVLVTPRLSATREEIQRAGLARLRAVTREAYFPYADDLSVYRMHWGWFPRPLPPIVAPLTRAAGTAAFQRYVRDHGMPDVLYAHNVFYAGVLVAALGTRFKLPTVMVEHSSSYLEGKVIFPRQKQLAQKTLLNIDVPLGVSRILVDSIRPYLQGKSCAVLGNFVDTEFFVPQALPPRFPFVFSWIAMLTQRVKRPDILLRAFAAAFGDAAAVRLQIRGDGFLRESIEKQIIAFNLGDRVQLLGASDRQGVRETIWQSHAIISSSDIETFGLTLAEALACGVPVVSTRCGGPEDYITPETGILVEPGDVDALAEGMRRIVAEYDRFDRDAARQIIVERFSEDALVKRLEAVFDQARGRR